MPALLELVYHQQAVSAGSMRHRSSATRSPASGNRPNGARRLMAACSGLTFNTQTCYA
jgi:hypothetical protein